jgi:chemosensory pili system protein ChpA (sensor histidine kinase/response regulator)
MGFNNHSSEHSLILLVEDDTPLLRDIAFLLEVAGYAVVTASDGIKALEMLRLHTPDLILSDVDMPHMDGYELLRNVRTSRRWGNIPLIFASGRYEYEDFMHALDLGATEYLPKPFNVQDLLDTIDRTLHMCTTDTRLKTTA